MNEDRQLTVLQSGQIAPRHPMDALAMMSEQEFEQRLQALKLAQCRMERIQRELMKEGVDYGVIPGTGDKPTLLKPGTERLCKFHHLVPTFNQESILGDGITTPHIRILTTCSLHYESEDGPIVAQGLGAANSWEKKYRWRDGQRRCPTCGAAAIIKGKAEYGGGYLCWAKKGGCGAKFAEEDATITEQQIGQVENPDPFDTENTLEKMSAKRAQTDATLRATATSGLFSQDLEDIGEQEADKPRQASSRTKPNPTKPVAQPTAPKPNAASRENDVDYLAASQNVGEFLTRAHKATGLNQKDMLNLLGKQNALQITDFGAAAKTLLGSVPGPATAGDEEEGEQQ